VWWNDKPEKVHAYAASAWQVVATDLIRGLNTSSNERDRFDFDFNSPFFTEAGVRILANGNVQEKSGGGGYANATQWLDYHNAHDLWNYGMWFTDDDSHDLDVTPSSSPIAWSSTRPVTSTQTWETTNTTLGTEEGRFTIRFNDYDSPGPAQVHLTFGITVSCENNPF